MTDTVVYLLSLHAQFSWMRIALTVLAIGFWILVVSVAYLSSAREVEGITPGFKGLLFVFVALQSMTPIRATLDLFLALRGPDGNPESWLFGVRGDFPLASGALTGLVAIDLLLALVSFATMMRRSRRFPGIFEVHFYYYISYNLLAIPLVAAIMNLVYDAEVPVAHVFVHLLDYAPEWGAILVVGGLSLAYLTKSRRADITFVR